MVSLWVRSSPASCDFFLFVYRSIYRYLLVCFGCFIRTRQANGSCTGPTQPGPTQPTKHTREKAHTYYIRRTYTKDALLEPRGLTQTKKRSSHLTRPNSGVGRQRSSSSCGRVRLQHGFAALQSPPLAARARTWARPTNKVKEGTSTGLSATKIDR